MSANRFRGFTLVEVLIVVVIMAVLAAVVIPQFSSSTDDAKRSTGEFNLSTMRSLIQTYKGQHNGVNPAHDATAKSLTVLLSKTKADGTIDATNGVYGPYLVEFPENPFTRSKDVKVITNDPAKAADVTAGNAGGWLYNATTGGIWLDSDPGYTY
jgi:prepilin-type N-terminal cleavage/methylation domain-containing protein